MTNADDLNGHWRGIYNYPHGHDGTAFDADITDSAGTLSGTISERDSWTDGRPLIAGLDGRRNGGHAQFTKFYDDEQHEYDVVHYEGRVTDDGCEISGRWDIPGEWSGTFIMTRPARIAVPVVSEAVDVVS